MLRRRTIIVFAVGVSTSFLGAAALGLLVLSSFVGTAVVDAKVTTRTTPVSKRSAKRPIQIINDGKAPFRVFWVNPDTKEEVLMSSDAGVMPGTEFPLEYVGV
jgi:hypothetical protein